MSRHVAPAPRRTSAAHRLPLALALAVARRRPRRPRARRRSSPADRAQPAARRVRPAAARARHRDVRRRPDRRPGDAPSRPRPHRPADAPPAARPGLRAGVGDAGGGHDRRRERRLPGRRRSSSSTRPPRTRWAPRPCAPPGCTGEGVTVAVVDSGCDASHPDLADHVIHNVKLYSGEYVNQYPPTRATTIVVAERDRRRTRTPTSAAATARTSPGSSPPTRRPTRPAAASASRPTPSLVCYSVGEVAVHDRRRDRLRPPARPARPVGRRRHQQLVGQLVPAVRPARPGRGRHEGRRRPRRRSSSSPPATAATPRPR